MTTTQEVTAWRVTDMFTFLRGENYQIVKQWFHYSETKRGHLQEKHLESGSQGNFYVLQLCKNVKV